MLDKFLYDVDYKNIKHFLTIDELDNLKILYKKEIGTDHLQGSLIKSQIDKIMCKLFGNDFFE